MAPVLLIGQVNYLTFLKVFLADKNFVRCMYGGTLPADNLCSPKCRLRWLGPSRALRQRIFLAAINSLDNSD